LPQRLKIFLQILLLLLFKMILQQL